MLFIGDYNAIYNVDQRQGTRPTTYEINDMNSWMEEMHLHALKEVGHEFPGRTEKKGKIE